MIEIVIAAGWPIWPLIVCSVLALALILERFYGLQAKYVAPKLLTLEAIHLMRQGGLTDKTVDELEKNSFLGAILAAGLRAYSHTKNHEEIYVVVEATGKQVTQKLERNLIPLATIASAAPLIGLLGTVIGMIQIFGAQGAQLGLNMDTSPAELAYGISTALYSTAFGLMIAIPSLIFWRYFRSRVDTYLLQLELDAAHFVGYLKSLG